MFIPMVNLCLIESLQIFFGIPPKKTLLGDRIFLLEGGKVLFVLRGIHGFDIDEQEDSEYKDENSKHKGKNSTPKIETLPLIPSVVSLNDISNMSIGQSFSTDKKQTEEQFKLIGSAYMHSFMDGETETLIKMGKISRQKFILE